MVHCNYSWKTNYDRRSLEKGIVIVQTGAKTLEITPASLTQNTLVLTWGTQHYFSSLVSPQNTCCKACWTRGGAFSSIWIKFHEKLSWEHHKRRWENNSQNTIKCMESDFLPWASYRIGFTGVCVSGNQNSETSMDSDYNFQEKEFSTPLDLKYWFNITVNSITLPRWNE